MEDTLDNELVSAYYVVAVQIELVTSTSNVRASEVGQALEASLVVSSSTSAASKTYIFPLVVPVIQGTTLAFSIALLV